MTDQLPAALTPDWQPPATLAEGARIGDFLRWLAARGHRFADYAALWDWSVTNPAAFWAAFADWAGVVFDTPATGPILQADAVEGARWFEGAHLNYAAQILHHPASDRAAILHQAEDGTLSTLSWADLHDRVSRLAGALRALGIGPGDRVAGYLPNRPETVIAFLATASLGAVWSLCAPEMGAPTVIARLEQIAPRLILTASSYDWNGRRIDRAGDVQAMLGALPGLEHWVSLGPDGGATAPKGIAAHDFDALLAGATQPAQPVPMPFDAPLWVVFSSGTTGAPKPIVHGHGGIVLEQLKLLMLHEDTGPDDRYCWLSSTGWVMWNAQVSALMTGATILLVEGAVNHPDAGRIWRLLGKTGVTLFGAGAAWLTGLMTAGVVPRDLADLTRLRMLGSTGSPLPPEAYDWAWRNIRPDLWIAPISGGTDFAGAFLAGLPTLPLRRGVMQTRCLGAHVQAFGDDGQPLTDAVGELVCTTPIPSMPLYFWGDDDGSRLHAAYFDTFPGLWRHGDWIRIDADGGAVIFGRSDSTINRNGVRMGTADIYRVTEAEPGIRDSLVVDLEYLGRPAQMILFVVLEAGATLDDTLKGRLRARLRAEASPHHLPDRIVAAPDVPYTLTGKKMEIPVRKMLLGLPADKAAVPGAMANPDSLPWYAGFARALAG